MGSRKIRDGHRFFNEQNFSMKKQMMDERNGLFREILSFFLNTNEKNELKCFGQTLENYRCFTERRNFPKDLIKGLFFLTEPLILWNLLFKNY